MPIRLIAEALADPMVPSNPLYHVDYYFVNGARDPIVPILRGRPLVLFHVEWVVRSIAADALLGVEPFIVGGVFIKSGERVKAEVEPDAAAGTGEENGEIKDELDDRSIMGETGPADSPKEVFEVAHLPSQDGLTIDRIDHESTPRTVPFRRHSSNLVQAESYPTLFPRQASAGTRHSRRKVQAENADAIAQASDTREAKDTVSTLPQVYVDPSAFLSQQKLVNTALKRKRDKPRNPASRKLRLTSSSLTPLPERDRNDIDTGPSALSHSDDARGSQPAHTPVSEIDQHALIGPDPRPTRSGDQHISEADKNGVVDQTGVQLTPATPDMNKYRPLNLKPLLEHTPISSSPPRTTLNTRPTPYSPPSITSSVTVTATATERDSVDLKQRRFRYNLLKKKVFDFDEVYDRLWDSERGDAKILGVERA